MDDITPLRALAQTEPLDLSSGIHLFKPQEIFQAAISRPNGERFRADHFFSGTNKSRSAQVYYYCVKMIHLKEMRVKLK